MTPLNADLETARRQIPSFDRIGFMPGRVIKLLVHGSELYGWYRDGYGIIASSLNNSESTSILRAMQAVAESRATGTGLAVPPQTAP